jgi:hypothetical protein
MQPFDELAIRADTIADRQRQLRAMGMVVDLMLALREPRAARVGWLRVLSTRATIES